MQTNPLSRLEKDMNYCKSLLLFGFVLALPALAAAATATPTTTITTPTMLTPDQAFQELSQQSKNASLLPAPVTNHPSWSGSITLGASMERGNEDMVLVTGKVLAKRRSDVNEVSLDMDGMYGENDSVKNSESLHGYGQINHLWTQHWYGFFREDGLHDGMEDLDYRFTTSPGVGYYLLRQTNVAFAVEAGPSLVGQRMGDNDETYAGCRLATRAEYKLNATTRFWETTEVISQMDAPDNNFFNVEVGVEATLAKNFALQLSLQDSYCNEAAEGYKNNDVRLISGVSYKF
jgi:putative salt-induced outer membrane protein YdiY